MKRYEIAGLQIDMELSGRTAAQAEPYAVTAEGPADMAVSCDGKVILELNPHLETEDMAQYMGTGTIFAKKLLDFAGFQLHASAVSLEGRAYLFSAPSGTGKSTHTEKWIRLFGAQYINDDKPALRQASGVWTVYGTPWSGKHDLSDPRGFPLGGIAFLTRGEENQIRRLTPAEALPYLMHESVRRLSPVQMEKFLTLADRLLRQTPVWLLTCQNNDEAAFVAREAMTSQEAPNCKQ